MNTRLHFWFDERPFADRRKACSRLKRATREAEQLEESQIDYWLELGRTALHEGYPARRPQPKKAA